MTLRRQLAFLTQNAEDIPTSQKETQEGLDVFQPSPSLGRGIRIYAIDLAAVAHHAFPLTGDRYSIKYEAQLSDSAKFGQKENVIAAVFLGTKYVQQDAEGLASGNGTDSGAIRWNPLPGGPMEIPLPGAIYLHAEFVNLDSINAVPAQGLKLAATATLWYDYI